MLLVIDKVPPPLPQQHFPLSPFHPSHTFTQTHDRPQLVYTMYKSPPSRSSSPIPHPPLQSLPPTITKIRMMNVPPSDHTPNTPIPHRNNKTGLHQLLPQIARGTKRGDSFPRLVLVETWVYVAVRKTFFCLFTFSSFLYNYELVTVDLEAYK